MSRDAFDMFAPPERGRFGDNERASVRGAKIEGKSDLVDLTLKLEADHPEKKAIAVTDPAKPDAKWTWLPRSLIEYEPLGEGAVKVTLPEWVAVQKGFV